MTYILEIGDRRRLKAGIRVLHHTGHRHPAPVGGSNFAERAAPRERLRREMEVAGRRLDVAMAEQALHRMEIDAGLYEMRGKGVAQAVDAAALGDARPALGAHIDAERGADGDVAFRPLAGEEPRRGPGDTPVRPQFSEEPLGEQRVAIAWPFAALDADHHALAVDVPDLERDHLAHPQSSGV